MPKITEGRQPMGESEESRIWRIIAVKVQGAEKYIPEIMWITFNKRDHVAWWDSYFHKWRYGEISPYDDEPDSLGRYQVYDRPPHSGATSAVLRIHAAKLIPADYHPEEFDAKEE